MKQMKRTKMKQMKQGLCLLVGPFHLLGRVEGGVRYRSPSAEVLHRHQQWKERGAPFVLRGSSRSCLRCALRRCKKRSYCTRDCQTTAWKNIPSVRI